MIYVNTFYINYIIQLFLKTFIPVISCKQYLLCVWYIHALWLCIVAVAKWLLINCECAWFFFILYEITSQSVSVFLLRDPHTFTNTPGFLWERKKEIKTNVNKTYFFNTTHCLHIKKKKKKKLSTKIVMRWEGNTCTQGWGGQCGIKNSANSHFSYHTLLKSCTPSEITHFITHFSYHTLLKSYTSQTTQSISLILKNIEARSPQIYEIICSVVQTGSNW